MPAHAEEFEALFFPSEFLYPPSVFELSYRIDAEEMRTITGKLPIRLPEV